MAEKCQFLRQISVIWFWVVSLYSPSPIWRVLDSEIKLHGMPLNPFNKCFRGLRTKKTPFLAGKWPKNSNFYPESEFSGSAWSVGAPLTIF